MPIDSIDHFRIEWSSDNANWNLLVDPVPGGGAARSYLDNRTPNPTFFYRMWGYTVNGIQIGYNNVRIDQSATPGRFLWVKTWSTGQNDTAAAIRRDPFGRFIVASNDAGTMTVRKFETDGTLLWTVQTASGSAYPNAICFDPTGNFYVAANAAGSVSPGNGLPIIPPVGGGATEKCVIIKYNTDGQPQWGQYVSPSPALATSFASDIAYHGGFLWVAGTTAGTVNLGGSDKTSLQDLSPMIFKLDAATGAFTGVGEVYGLAYPGGQSWGHGVAVGADGGPYMVGKAFGSPTAGGVNFGNGTATLKPTDQDGAVGYIVRFNSSLQAQWSKQTSTNYREDIVHKIAVNQVNGNISIAGIYRDALDLGNGVTLPTQPGLPFYQDGFGAVLQSDGTALWARRFGGNVNVHDHCLDTCWGNNGDVIFVGTASGEIDWGAGLAGGGFQAGFTVRYSSTGSFRWIRRISGVSQQLVRSVAVDTLDNVLACGQWVGNTQIGGTSFDDQNPSDVKYGLGGSEAFVTKYSA